MRLVLSVLIALAAPAALAEENPPGCLDSFDPAASYFPAGTVLRHAENFTVEYGGSYKLVTVHDPAPGVAVERFVLVQCGAPEPRLAGDFARAPVISVPVGSVYSASAAHPVMLAAIGRLDALSGSTQRTAYDPALRARIDSGDVAVFEPNNAMGIGDMFRDPPDIVLTGGTEASAFRVLRNAGIVVVPDSSLSEATLLARAEWLKFVALFFNAEAEAEAIFAGIDARYAAAMALVANVPDLERPQVLIGGPLGDGFAAAGGSSPFARLVADAGGRTVFPGPEAGTVPDLAVDDVLAAAGDAPFWLNAPAGWRSLADIVAAAPLLADLPSAQSGAVWMNDRLADGGTIAILEAGILQPDVILMDMIRILHADRAQDHEPVFYRSITVP